MELRSIYPTILWNILHLFLIYFLQNILNYFKIIYRSSSEWLYLKNIFLPKILLHIPTLSRHRSRKLWSNRGYNLQHMFLGRSSDDHVDERSVYIMYNDDYVLVCIFDNRDNIEVLCNRCAINLELSHCEKSYIKNM